MEEIIVTATPISGNPVSGSIVVLRAGKIIIEDTLAGKITSPYRRSYAVDSGEGELVVKMCDMDRKDVQITAAKAPIHS